MICGSSTNGKQWIFEKICSHFAWILTGENKIFEIFSNFLLANHSGLQNKLIHVFKLIGSVTIKQKISCGCNISNINLLKSANSRRFIGNITPIWEFCFILTEPIKLKIWITSLWRPEWLANRKIQKISEILFSLARIHAKCEQIFTKYHYFP